MNSCRKRKVQKQQHRLVEEKQSEGKTKVAGYVSLNSSSLEKEGKMELEMAILDTEVETEIQRTWSEQ